jgi:hypothetical protein
MSQQTGIFISTTVRSSALKCFTSFCIYYIGSVVVYCGVMLICTTTVQAYCCYCVSVVNKYGQYLKCYVTYVVLVVLNICFFNQFVY